jgi:hypothetical protein
MVCFQVQRMKVLSKLLGVDLLAPNAHQVWPHAVMLIVGLSGTVAAGVDTDMLLALTRVRLQAWLWP